MYPNNHPESKAYKPLPETPRTLAADKIPDCCQVIAPGNPSYGSAHIPERFYGMIASHCACVYLNRPDSRFATPLFLMVSGEPGTGKTYQAIATCLDQGMTVVYCSSSRMTGKDLSASADVAESVYRTALMLLSFDNTPAVVFDDFHMSEASVADETVTTVNSNLMTGRLMNIVDSPALEKVPVIFTANSYVDIDEALLRDGRSRIFDWSPNHYEVFTTVASLYSGLLSTECIEALFEAYPDENIAFYSALVPEAQRLRLEDALLSHQMSVDRIASNRAYFGYDIRLDDIMIAANHLKEARKC